MKILIVWLSLAILFLEGCGGGGGGGGGTFSAPPTVQLSCAGLSGTALLNCKQEGGM